MHGVSGKPRKAERYDAVWLKELVEFRDSSDSQVNAFQERLVMASDTGIDHPVIQASKLAGPI